MVGLLGIGLALILGIGMRVAAVSGAVLYVLMWTAALPMTTNPILDDHITGAMTLIVLALTAAGTTWGLGTLVGQPTGRAEEPLADLIKDSDPSIDGPPPDHRRRPVAICWNTGHAEEQERA